MSDKPTLEDILAVYNSISPSRRRWVRNRVGMRNSWKELFQALEKASGRDGGKVVVFDKNWHEVAKKGSTTGAVNKSAKEEKQLDIEVEAAKVDEKKAPAKKPAAKK